MADPTQDSFFREIQEELREESLRKLWKNYGAAIIAAVLFLVLSVAGYQGWIHYDTWSRAEDGKRFAAVESLARDGKLDEALQAFADLSRDGRAGYALLARFREAALLSGAGRLDEAAEAYDRIAAEEGTDTLYRNLATVLSVLHAMDSGDGTQLMARLAPIAKAGNPWRHSARELSAVLALSAGDTGTASEILSDLKQDVETPSGIRARAGEMLAGLTAQL